MTMEMSPVVAPDLPFDIAEAAQYVRSADGSSEKLVRAMQQRADALVDLGVYLTRFDEPALVAAVQADAELAAGNDRGPLHGIPIGVKDIFATSEGPTTAQSLANPPDWGQGIDCTAVTRLRQAGAVILGKTTTMEFAIGLPDESRPFPIPRNPWDFDCWAGGSSSGSGSGVAAGLFAMGLGSDTGGSIRIPAAYCGVTGLKPTFGRVPKDHTVPLAWTLDHVGPMARTARDCAITLGVLAGHHRADRMSVPHEVDDYVGALTGDLTGTRIGVVRHLLNSPAADALLRQRFEDAVSVLTKRGAEVREIALPAFDETQTASTMTLATESLAYHRNRLLTHWDEYGVNARAWFAMGALVTGGDQVQAQRVRRFAQTAVNDLLGEVDVLLTPTVPAEVGFLADLSLDWFNPIAAASVLFVSYWNLTGHPALSLPMGPGSSGLPLSLQVIGRHFDEATVLKVGDGFQSVTDWHLQPPTEITRRLSQGEEGER